MRETKSIGLSKPAELGKVWGGYAEVFINNIKENTESKLLTVEGGGVRDGVLKLRERTEKLLCLKRKIVGSKRRQAASTGREAQMGL